MTKLLTPFPYISLPSALLVLRLAVAAVFVGHAGMRLIAPHYFAEIGPFLASHGIAQGQLIAWIVTVLELVGGPLLVANIGTRWIALAFFFISAGSALLVQAHTGWWVAEHGDGGMEFSVVLCATCVFLAAEARSRFPFLSPTQGYAVLRVSLAAFFMIHAASRFTEPNYFQGLGLGLREFGMPFPYALGLAATAIELIGGSLLILDRCAKWVALGLFGISSVGILFIHLKLGWFVGEFGNGGAEFSVLLCAMCLVVAAMDTQRRTASATLAGSARLQHA